MQETVDFIDEWSVLPMTMVIIQKYRTIGIIFTKNHLIIFKKCTQAVFRSRDVNTLNKIINATLLFLPPFFMS